MTPERIRDISGVLTLIGFLFLLRQVYWQVRAQRRRHPRLRWYWALRLADRQTVSEFLFLSLTTAIVGQLMLSYLVLVGVPFGATERGPASYFAWCISVIWWGFCTERYNERYNERHNGRRKRGDDERPPLESVAE